MRQFKFVLPALVLATALGSAGAVTLPVPMAAAQPATAPQQPMRPLPPSRVEGRIAFLKAELKITPAQEAQFDKVAQAMRQNDRERRQAFERFRTERNQPRNAVQQLETRARFSALRARELDRYLAAFRPLYASLSPAQKQAADGLLAPHWRHHRGRI